MAVRSITVKLVVPRKQGGKDGACDLWTTHSAINEATAYYESRLLEMRGRGYFLKDGSHATEEEVVDRLAATINEALVRNGKLKSLSPARMIEVQQMLRHLYEAIVPSSIGEKGEAQQANAFLSPLTDITSQGFLSIFDKIETPPSWVLGARTGEPQALAAAGLWATTPDGKLRLQPTGSPPTWLRKFRKGDADWPTAFAADYDKKLEEAKGVPTIIKTLKKAGVLPLFPPCLTPLIIDAKGALSPWDRLAFRLAVAHLLSWESWGRITAEVHQKRKAQIEEFRVTYLERADFAPALTALNSYEQERALELARTSLGPVAPFRIRLRMVRHWPDLRKRWMASNDQSKSKLLAISADEQTRVRGGFGDPHLFAWLAEPANSHVWQRDTDVVTLLARYNALQALLERSRDHAAMTLPDATQHPRSVQWEPEGGSNLKNYKFVSTHGKLRAVLPLLNICNGQYREVAHTFDIAPTAQFQRALLDRNRNNTTITYENQTGEVFSGTLNSADLLLDWRHTRFRTPAALAAGNFGPAYLKVVLDLDPSLPSGWDGKRPQSVVHFTSALGNEKWVTEVRPGLRILSVDMGVRSFAACSVFELRPNAPGAGKLAYPVTGPHGALWAVHERSFVLRLPGEEMTPLELEWRSVATEELRSLRRGLSRYRQLYRLQNVADVARRIELLEDLQDAQREVGWPFEGMLLERLGDSIAEGESAWTAKVACVVREYRKEFSRTVQQWRRRTRQRSSDKGFGKSMWAIEHLTNVRRFLVSWSLAGEESGDIRRLDRGRRGIFASGLLDHIDNIKKDRLKTGADLVIQAARGYLRGGGGIWQQKYSPCQAVLFEDLTRYRMRTDRPRRENSQLMLWAHRQIPDVVAMQGEVYGINTCYTGAAFSSRYHAASNTPGIRCHPLTVDDLANDFFRQMVERENPGIQWGRLRPGDLIPRAGGELFACVSATGNKKIIHADVNAAQNLQRRFWTRHADPFRLPARKVNGEERWLPHKLGKRLVGGLGGYGLLVPTGHDSGSCRWISISPKQWRSFGGEVREGEMVDTDAVDVGELTEDILEESGEVVVFFRDPSGVALPKELWYPAKIFWSIIKAKTETAILNR